MEAGLGQVQEKDAEINRLQGELQVLKVFKVQSCYHDSIRESLNLYQYIVTIVVAGRNGR